jgi:hypothetical protein
MSHWNYRVFKHTRQDVERGGEEEWFTLNEVYYKDDGSFYAYAETPDIYAESVDELGKTLQMMLDDVERFGDVPLKEDDFPEKDDD